MSKMSLARGADATEYKTTTYTLAVASLSSVADRASHQTRASSVARSTVAFFSLPLEAPGMSKAVAFVDSASAEAELSGDRSVTGEVAMASAVAAVVGDAAAFAPKLAPPVWTASLQPLLLHARTARTPAMRPARCTHCELAPRLPSMAAPSADSAASAVLAIASVSRPHRAQASASVRSAAKRACVSPMQLHTGRGGGEGKFRWKVEWSRSRSQLYWARGRPHISFPALRHRTLTASALGLRSSLTMSGRSDEAAPSWKQLLPAPRLRSSLSGEENSRMTRAVQTALDVLRFAIFAREGPTSSANACAVRRRLTSARRGESDAYISSNDDPFSAKEKVQATADARAACATFLARSFASVQAAASTSGSAISLRREAPPVSLLLWGKVWRVVSVRVERRGTVPTSTCLSIHTRKERRYSLWFERLRGSVCVQRKERGAESSLFVGCERI